MKPRTVSASVSFESVNRREGGKDSRSDVVVGIHSLPSMLLECEKILRSMPDGVGDYGGEFKLLNAIDEGREIRFLVELSAP